MPRAEVVYSWYGSSGNCEAMIWRVEGFHGSLSRFVHLYSSVLILRIHSLIFISQRYNIIQLMLTSCNFHWQDNLSTRTIKFKHQPGICHLINERLRLRREMRSKPVWSWIHVKLLPISIWVFFIIIARGLRDKPFWASPRARPNWVEGLKSVPSIRWKYIICIAII